MLSSQSSKARLFFSSVYGRLKICYFRTAYIPSLGSNHSLHSPHLSLPSLKPMNLSPDAHKEYDYSIYDSGTKLLIPVNNYVDSRIGQFAFSHNFSATSFNQLLELLNDRDIRISELTFKSGADFERLIAKYREKLQHRTPDSSIGFPLVVLEGVMDAMRLEMGPFVVAVADSDLLRHEARVASKEFRNLLRTLRNMSLVHRSWVPLAHSLLHMRHCCKDGTIPKIPSWPVASAIRELIVEYNWDKESSLRSLNILLGRLPNLRALSIGMTDYEAGKYKESMHLVLETIGRLTNLEVLLFPNWKAPEPHNGSEAGDSTPYLFKLCESLSKLKKLSVLWLSGLQCSEEAAGTRLTEQLRNLKAPNLKTLVINIPAHPLSLPGHFLHWIIHSQKSPSLENLIISPDCLADNADVTTACINGPGFSNLKHLYLASSSGSIYDAIYPSANNLQALHLNIIRDRLPKQLPPRLEALIIQVRADNGQADETVMTLLERSDTGNIRKITLNVISFKTPRVLISTAGLTNDLRFCRTLVKMKRYLLKDRMWRGFISIVREILP